MFKAAPSLVGSFAGRTQASRPSPPNANWLFAVRDRGGFRGGGSAFKDGRLAGDPKRLTPEWRPEGQEGTYAAQAAAEFAKLQPSRLQQVLLTKYPPEAAIGWHKDRSVFGQVVGISLLSPCTFRFRRKTEIKWERKSFTAEPRSTYLLEGPSRSEWEHSIPAVETLRYSITFRNLREDTGT